MIETKIIDNNSVYKKFIIPQLIREIKDRNIYVKGLSKMNKRQYIDLLLFDDRINYSREKIYLFIVKHITSFFKKRCVQYRGNCVANKKLCVNETDFYTLEPLCNIPDNQFFSFPDSKGFYYGFNIFSFQHIIPMHGSRKKCLNPYTREEVEPSIQHNILRLLSLIRLTEPDIVNINDEPVLNDTIDCLASLNSASLSSALLSEPVLRFMGNVMYPRLDFLNEQQKSIMNLLIEKRQKNMDTRIEDLFYEINFLGNYTQREWFDHLSRNQYLRLFRKIFEFWFQTGNGGTGPIRRSVKNEVCYLTGDPFYNIFINSENASFQTTENIKEACLMVMENLTFTGKDDESRKLGVIYILINLSHVSDDAREAISWLN
jgi:hypothetical protein